jgi:ATP-dependent 26S proteasome regulatory subunit
MSEVLFAPPAPDRFDLALRRLAGRLGDVVAELGDEDAAAFLRDWSAADPTVGQHPADGSCLDLPAGTAQPIDRLVAALGATSVEVDLLALAALPHEHEAVAAVLRSLHPDGAPWPTVGLAGLLAERGHLAGVDHGRHPRRRLRAVLGDGSFAAAGVLAVDRNEDRPHAERSLRLGPLLYQALTGADGWPAGCRVDLRPSPPWGLTSWLRDPAVAAARTAIAARAGVTVIAAGDRPDALAGRLAAIVEAAGHRPVVLHVPVLDDRLVASILVLALARGTVPVLWSDEPAPNPLDLPDVPLPIVLAGPSADVMTWPRPRLVVPTAPLHRDDRVAAFEQAIPELAPLAHPLGPATLEPGEIAMAAADLRTRVRLGSAAGTRELLDVIDGHATARVPSSAILLHPVATWADLVLPDDRRHQLEEAAHRARHHATVFDEWGFSPGRSGRQGLRLLFCGPPGTGKTLAAEVMAHVLGRDLLVVDLSQMVSKWIGETEKNLAATFEAAERGGAVLFFDEADALFGRRTEVGDARDRYANLETAYLLTRLERFEGLGILATNLRQNLDPAFARRIEFIVPFDPPGAGERTDLWRRHLPATAPVSPSVDLERLSAVYELSGALIRNAALAAAFLAAADGTSITMRHLVHAVRREYVKAGHAFPGAPAGVALDADHPQRNGARPWPQR